MKKLSVVIVEDHKLLRELLIDLFDRNETFKVIGQSAGCQEAMEIIGVLKPDIVLLDLNLPDGSGLDIIPVIRKISMQSKIIVLSMHVHPAYAQKAIRFGADAYVTKNSPHQEILTAIDQVMIGDQYICSEIKTELSLHLLTSQSQNPDLELLSIREKDVLQYLKQGHSSKEIADTLNITLKTVQAHRHNIFKKLKVHNITSLINYVNKAELTYGSIS